MYRQFAMSSCEDEFWRKEEMEGRKRGRERREGKEGKGRGRRALELIQNTLTAYSTSGLVMFYS